MTRKWENLQTEAISQATRALDTLSANEIVALMIDDSRHVLDAARHETQAIAQGVDLIDECFRKGGRLIFVGAGTSGRLGVLEAAEMPPTFGLHPRRVKAVMAGGPGAVHQAREGVEDDAKAGERAIRGLGVTQADVVIGISASGLTPFVTAALSRARRDRAKTIAIVCVSSSPLNEFADVMISLPVGPEAIAGSTRLKAGTVTKIVLNTLTTAAMVRSGKTYGNLMVDVQTTSAKLRDRGRRIVRALTDLDEAAAGRLLARSKGNVKVAIVMQKCGIGYQAAVRRLAAFDGSLRRALDPGPS